MKTRTLIFQSLHADNLCWALLGYGGFSDLCIIARSQQSMPDSRSDFFFFSFVKKQVLVCLVDLYDDCGQGHIYAQSETGFYKYIYVTVQLLTKTE